MFCKQCGATLADNDKFCTACGTPVESSEKQAVDSEVSDVPITTESFSSSDSASAASAPSATMTLDDSPSPEHTDPSFTPQDNSIKKGISPRGIGIIAVAAVVIVVLSIIALSFSGGSYKTVLSKYVKSVEKADADTYLNLINKQYFDYYEDELDMSREDIRDELQDSLDDLKEEFEDNYGKFKLTYKITKTDKYDKEELDDLKETLNSWYDIKESSVKNAVELTFDININGKEDDDSDEATLIVVKIDGKWYVAYPQTY